jgi:hypothetical protein
MVLALLALSVGTVRELRQLLRRCLSALKTAPDLHENAHPEPDYGSGSHRFFIFAPQWLNS